jgi:hypothetical protein
MQSLFSNSLPTRPANFLRVYPASLRCNHLILEEAPSQHPRSPDILSRTRRMSTPGVWGNIAEAVWHHTTQTANAGHLQ